MRFFKILSFVTPLSLWIIFPLLEWLFPNQIPQIKPLLMFSFSGILLLICFIVYLFIEWYEKKLFKKHATADYKMFFNIYNENTRSYSNAFEQVLKLVGADEEDLNGKMKTWVRWDEGFDVGKLITRQNEHGTGAIPPAEAEKPLLSELFCRKIFSDRKAGKCFIQCMFVPLDKNGDTLNIRRLDEYHPSLSMTNKRRARKGLGKKIQGTFISFSPIPDYFGQEFDPLDAYHNEVKRREEADEPELRFHGFILRRKIFDDKSCCFYLMLIYSVRYAKECFDDDGIYRIFASKESEPPAPAFWEKLLIDGIHSRARGRRRYFEKDHDDILGCISWKQLHEELLSEQNGDGDEKKSYLAGTAEEEIIKYFHEKSKAGKKTVSGNV